MPTPKGSQIDYENDVLYITSAEEVERRLAPQKGSLPLSAAWNRTRAFTCGRSP
jgi:hypothetical protein